MKWHARVLQQPRCRCSSKATVEVFNDKNSSQGRYCRSCATRMIKAEEGTKKTEPWRRSCGE